MQIYELANDAAEAAIVKWNENEIGEFCKYHCKSRLFYLCSVVTNAVAFPFTAVAALFRSLYALCLCNTKEETFRTQWKYTIECSNHFFLSIIGSLFSPSIAHRYRDANLTPYVIVARITIVTGALLYYALSKK